MPPHASANPFGMPEQPGLEKIPVTGVFFKGGFRAFRLGRRVRHHLAPVDALRPPQQGRARLAETPFPECFRTGQHIGHGTHAQGRQRRDELLSHPGNARKLQFFQKTGYILMPEQIQPVRLVDVRTDFCQKLHRSNPHRTGKPARGFTYCPFEGHSHILHRPEQALQPRGIKISLVNGGHFHQGGKTVQHAFHHARHLSVPLVSARHKNTVRAQAFRLVDGHGRMHAELARLIGTGAHHTPLALPDDQGLAPQFRVIQLLNGGKKSVHVDVHEPAKRRRAGAFRAVYHNARNTLPGKSDCGKIRGIAPENGVYPDITPDMPRAGESRANPRLPLTRAYSDSKDEEALRQAKNLSAMQHRILRIQC